LFTQSSSNYQRAAHAEALGQNIKATYLNNAGAALMNEAQERQKPNPSYQSIYRFTQSADMFKQAVETKTAGRNNKAWYLNNAGTALMHAALEAQKPEPKQRSIDLFTQEASSYQQAAEADEGQDAGQNIKARMLGQNIKAGMLQSAGTILRKAAQEAQKPNYDQQIIDVFTHAASNFQQSAEATAAGQYCKGGALSWVGSSLFEAAMEAQKPEPNQQIIDWFSESASLYQQTVEAGIAVQFMKGKSLTVAALAFYNAAKEAQQINPNQQRIEQYLKEAEDSKIEADQLCTIS